MTDHKEERIGVEARADQELRRMGAFLAGLPSFALEAEETACELMAGEPRRQLTIPTGCPLTSETGR